MINGDDLEQVIRASGVQGPPSHDGYYVVECLDPGNSGSNEFCLVRVHTSGRIVPVSTDGILPDFIFWHVPVMTVNAVADTDATALQAEIARLRVALAAETYQPVTGWGRIDTGNWIYYKSLGPIDEHGEGTAPHLRVKQEYGGCWKWEVSDERRTRYHGECRTAMDAMTSAEEAVKKLVPIPA